MRRWRGIIVPLVVLLVAEITFRATVTMSDSLAPPSRAVGALLGALADGTLLANTARTLAGMLGGLAIGGIAGLVAGIAIGFSETLRRASFFPTALLWSGPSAALVPPSPRSFPAGCGLE